MEAVKEGSRSPPLTPTDLEESPDPTPQPRHKPITSFILKVQQSPQTVVMETTVAMETARRREVSPGARRRTTLRTTLRELEKPRRYLSEARGHFFERGYRDDMEIELSMAEVRM